MIVSIVCESVHFYVLVWFFFALRRKKLKLCRQSAWLSTKTTPFFNFFSVHSICVHVCEYAIWCWCYCIRNNMVAEKRFMYTDGTHVMWKRQITFACIAFIANRIHVSACLLCHRYIHIAVVHAATSAAIIICLQYKHIRITH